MACIKYDLNLIMIFSASMQLVLKILSLVRYLNMKHRIVLKFEENKHFLRVHYSSFLSYLRLLIVPHFLLISFLPNIACNYFEVTTGCYRG